jgi:hypothetical protein
MSAIARVSLHSVPVCASKCASQPRGGNQLARLPLNALDEFVDDPDGKRV